MQPKDFIFFIQDKQNRFWGLNDSGNVVLSSNPYPLKYSPAGWEDVSIKNIRNKKYWAIDRIVSAPFKYVEDGAEILKHIFYKKGVEEQAYLVICEARLDYKPSVSYGFWYKQVFKAEFDFNTFSHSGPIVEVTTVEEGFAKHLKANENTVYEFDLSSEGTVNIKMDGILLDYKRNYTILPEQAVTGTGNFFLGMTEVSREGEISHVSWFNVPAVSAGSYPNDNYVMSASETQVVRITGILKLYMNKSCTPIIRLEINDGASSGSTQIDLHNAAHTIGETVEAEINQTFTVPAGSRVHIRLLGGNPSDPTAQYTVIDKNLDFSYEHKFATTYIRGFRPQLLFSELIIRMSNGEFSGEDCPYFSNLKHWNKVFTSGDGIRGTQGSLVKISFSQFFSFWDTFDSVGIREKNRKILFDRKRELTDFAAVIDLGEVSKLTIQYDSTFPFNEMSAGYPDIKNETGVLNGKNEVNTTFNFSLGTIKSPRKYDKISQVKTSCYDIENTRVAGYLKDTTDNRNDNDVYCIHIVNTLTAGTGDIPDHYELDRTYNTYVTGVDQISSVFNLIFSPKNCIIRSGDFIRSSFYKCDNRVFKYTSADRNSNMAYINGSNIVVENADIPMSSLSNPFFTPVIIRVECSPPEDMNDLFDANPLQIFQFSFEGKLYKGVSVENSVNPKTNKKQTFTMLSIPDNDLTSLIKQFN